MSTKGSVCFGGSWHLYTECFDEDPAQLHLDVGMVSRPSDPDDPPLPPTTPNVTIDAMVHVVFPREAVQRIAEFYQRQIEWEEKLRKESAGSSFAPSNEVEKQELPSAPLIPQSRAEEMVAEEREACAKVADQRAQDYRTSGETWAFEGRTASVSIAAAIRARKEASRG